MQEVPRYVIDRFELHDPHDGTVRTTCYVDGSDGRQVACATGVWTKRAARSLFDQLAAILAEDEAAEPALKVANG